ncbi:pyridoxamine 5'-phosphate oxidase family protein [Streptomyces sp. NPDC059881]|uniref:pyridoxamine 5'-phosphate oxidase family protein n=1 Tax=Streptomyces sp. NPDC059881 TaxID=3346986 RepID=UPI0036631160
MVELRREDALDLLSSVRLGRVAFSHQALPAIRPVNHVVDADDIVIRTHADSMLLSSATDSEGVVAYEADEFDLATCTGWSVVVTGLATLVTDEAELDRFGRPSFRVSMPARAMWSVSGRRWSPATAWSARQPRRWTFAGGLCRPVSGPAHALDIFWSCLYRIGRPRRMLSTPRPRSLRLPGGVQPSLPTLPTGGPTPAHHPANSSQPSVHVRPGILHKVPPRTSPVRSLSSGPASVRTRKVSRQAALPRKVGRAWSGPLRRGVLPPTRRTCHLWARAARIDCWGHRADRLLPPAQHITKSDEPRVF